MSARFDPEVMEHLEKLYRRHLAKESVQPPSVAAARLSIGESVAFASPGQNPVAVFHENVSNENILRPRRLSLRVF